MTHRLAVIQMNCSSNIDENFNQAEFLLKRAKNLGADLACLPENFAFMGCVDGDTALMAQNLDGPLMLRYRKLARKLSLCLSLGGFPEIAAGTEKTYNAHLVLDSQGQLLSCYRKIHLFSVHIPDGQHYNEGEKVIAGTEVVVVNSPIGKLGLSICYDLRFPELYIALANRGAEILLIPAAFTAHTGKAHWEILLRARAIENQCYVAAAAQTGTHNHQRKTHGHAMIIDPWGTIIAQCSEGQQVAVADIDLSYLAEIRINMPVANHRRSEYF